MVVLKRIEYDLQFSGRGAPAAELQRAGHPDGRCADTGVDILAGAGI